jgi:hypothetical protein
MMDYVVTKAPQVTQDRYLDVVPAQLEQRRGLWAQHLFPLLVTDDTH